MTPKTLQNEAMRLPTKARAALATALLSSLDTEEPADIESAWVVEADRRYKAHKTGRVGGITAEVAIREARKALR